MYHGEYKVPGGKLIVVDCEIADGRLSNVVISGDFFLAPDEALAWMMAALEQAPSDSSEEELAERVRAATVDAELLGITPEGVAIAVRRAVAGGAA
jgi:lipoate-protein ligase A